MYTGIYYACYIEIYILQIYIFTNNLDFLTGLEYSSIEKYSIHGIVNCLMYYIF